MALKKRKPRVAAPARTVDWGDAIGYVTEEGQAFMRRCWDRMSQPSPWGKP